MKNLFVVFAMIVGLLVAVPLFANEKGTVDIELDLYDPGDTAVVTITIPKGLDLTSTSLSPTAAGTYTDPSPVSGPATIKVDISLSGTFVSSKLKDIKFTGVFTPNSWGEEHGEKGNSDWDETTVGDWVKQDDEKDWGKVSEKTNPKTGQNLAVVGISSPDMTSALAYGMPWSTDDYEEFTADTIASETLWKQIWKWVPNAAPVKDSSFRLFVKWTFKWEIKGNANNVWPSAAYAKTHGHSQIVIESYPGTTGDQTVDGEWSGEKTEGDRFSGGLNITWPPGITLGWASDPTDEWLSKSSKTNQFAQNIDNEGKKTVFTEISLLSEAHAAGSNNNMWAFVNNSVTVDTFTLEEN